MGEYIKTIANQQNIIDKLRANNKDLDIQKTQLMATQSSEAFNISRIVTTKNVLNDDLGFLAEEDHQTSYDSDDNETQMIEELKSQINTLKKQMSSMEDDTEDSVQKILDLAQLGRSNN